MFTFIFARTAKSHKQLFILSISICLVFCIRLFLQICHLPLSFTVFVVVVALHFLFATTVVQTFSDWISTNNKKRRKKTNVNVIISKRVLIHLCACVSSCSQPNCLIILWFVFKWWTHQHWHDSPIKSKKNEKKNIPKTNKNWQIFGLTEMKYVNVRLLFHHRYYD